MFDTRQKLLDDINREAKQIAHKKVDWKKDPSVWGVLQGNISRYQCQMVPVHVTFGGYTMRYYVSRCGDLYQGDPAELCKLTDFDGYTERSLYTVLKHFREYK